MGFERGLAGIAAHALAVYIGLHAQPESARADAATPYCEKVSARADSDAALLISPRLALQGMRYPSGFDFGPVSDHGYQMRIAVSFSATDAYRGLRLAAVSGSDCAAQRAFEQFRLTLDHVEVAPQRSAYHAQADFLESHRTEWQAVLERAGLRLKAQVITAIEFKDVVRQTNELERKTEQARGSAARLDASLKGVPARSPALLAHDFVQSAIAHERQLAGLRSIEAWRLTLNAGVMPFSDDSAGDWFGMVELSYSFGDLFRRGAESRYRHAREDELREASYEMPAQLERLRAQLAAQVAQADRELRVVDRQLAFLRNTRSALEAFDETAAGHARDALTIEELAAESEQVFLRVLIESLSRLETGERG